MGILFSMISGATAIAAIITIVEIIVIITVISAIFKIRKETKRIRRLLEIQIQINISDIEEEDYREQMIRKYDDYRLL